MRSPAPREQPLVIGRYELHGEIASGGMATVHVGRQIGSEGFARTVAIKRLHPQFAKDRDFCAMLLDEARLTSRIKHPNVVTVLDVVKHGDELLMVMEYVVGESLVRLARGRAAAGGVPPPIAASILAGVLHGLHAAHEARGETGAPLHIVHRDVSPQNVVVGVEGMAHVLDFGVAKAAVRIQESTVSGQLKGKIGYMAPEQLSHGEIDRRVDIWAAGVVLWEALTGRRLFGGDQPGQVVMAIASGEITPLGTFAPGLPAALEAVVLRALHKNPEERFGTAREMAVALEAAVPVASLLEVGAWVERVASAALHERAGRIAAMESNTVASARRPSPPEAVSGPTAEAASSRAVPAAPASRPVLGDGTEETLAALSSKDVRTPERAAPRFGRSLLLVGALGGAAAAAWMVAGAGGGSSRVETATPEAPVSAAGAAALAPSPAAPSEPSVAASGEVPAGPLASASATAEATRSTASAVPARPPPARAPGGAKPKPDCAQPFTYETIEGKTIKKWKPECL